ncbi:MAG: trypsin-like serine protease [Deltaproteobacteria bacterium]|nr:trypsin-like serine protease [Deltaproteobacteria bacterium]
MQQKVSLVLLLTLSAFGCMSAPDTGDVAASSEAVYFGSTTTDYPEVVAVVRLGRTGSGGLCTGTLIGPYTVMTAKHCVFQEGTTTWTAVRPSDFLVVVGSDINSASGVVQTSNVYEIRTTPGSNVNSDINTGQDIALVLLPAPLDIAPREYARSAPGRNAAVTMVGFGRNGGAAPDTGVKYVGTARVNDVRGGLIATAGTSGTCQGDSGGPLFDPSGAVTGITSFGPGNCNNTFSVFTQVSRHAALIEDALAFRPPCVSTTEVCDGVDNDCDGVIDPGCTGLGEACTADLECSGGGCEAAPSGTVCVRDCDPRNAIPHCPFGFYCEATGCGTGRCIEGNPGPKAAGEACAGNLECASDYCGEAGGAMLCGRQCGDADNPCDEGQVCEMAADGCGVCIPAELSAGPRPFGAPCDANADCLSDNCLDGDFCTAACSDSAPCLSGFHCRTGECVRGDLVGAGNSCGSAEDCSSTAPECVSVDGDFICASACMPDCAPGFACAATDVGDRCVPPGLGLGVECSANADCRSGICASVCTILCDDSTCPAGYECRPAGEHSGCFVPAPSSGGGCALTPTRSSDVNGLWLLLGLAALAWRRRSA